MAGLLAGLATGLSRMGWDVGILSASLHHGSVMVGGFLGTLIALEKVIPLKRKMLYLIPVCSGASVFVFFVGDPIYAFALLLLAALALSSVFLYYLVTVRDFIYFLMLCGGLSWLAGNAVLASQSLYPAAFPWWVAFILFIITAERLELTKFLPVPSSRKRWLVLMLFLYVAGVVWSFHAGGQWISGAALVGVSLWLMKFDVVGLSIQKSGLQKFIGTALLCGYVALLLTGVFLIALTQHPFAYDAIVHTFFLGFAFSMIFAHGPVILPGVLGMRVKPWHRMLYVWLILLHVSLAVRVISDLSFDLHFRKTTGVVSTVAILGYFLTVATALFKIQRRHAKVL